MLEDFSEILNKTIFTIGETSLKISSVITLLLFWLILIIILKIIKKSIYRANNIDTPKKYSVYMLIKYLVLVIAIVISLDIIGFNLSIILAGSAALLVGLGLGIQNLFSDYVSGIIILIDNSIKIDDVIEVNGVVGTVKEIHLRTTTVLTRDDKYIIVPNTDLTRNNLINWTHNKQSSRFNVSVGVDYSTDVNLVHKLLLESAYNEPMVLQHPKPFVRFTEFGDSALEFSIFFWVDEVFIAEHTKSNIRMNILDRFRLSGINIPFPQRVIHLAEI